MTGPGDDRPPPASGAASFNKWLAGGVPTFVAGLLVANFGQNPWFVLPALGAAAVYGVWWAPTTKHGPLIRRLLTPILVLAYTAFLVVVAVVPDLPPVWQVTVPCAIFIATAITAARSYGDTGIFLAGGITLIGIGIAVTAVGIAALLDNNLTGGIALIGLGIALIGGGIARILDHDLTGGIALIGGGIAFILDHQLTFGIAGIGAGIAGIGIGIAGILDHDLTLGIAGIGLGIALTGGGIALVLDHDLTGPHRAGSVRRYRVGDYWTIPARIFGDISRTNTQTPVPPDGVQHHYAPLAWINSDGGSPPVTDLRKQFTPLATCRPQQP